MMINYLFSGLRAIFSFIWRSEDKKEKRRLTVSSELDVLADMFNEVLEATDKNGKINKDNIHDLHRLRKRNFARWGDILESRSFFEIPDDLRKEVIDTLKIVHFAPGSYIREIYRVEKFISEGYMDKKSLIEFKNSIDRLRNVAVKLRLL